MRDDRSFAAPSFDLPPEEARPGWIYCITNPSMPGLVKIGLTTGSVQARMRQLDTTGVAEPFDMVEAWLTPDTKGDERRAHALLRRHRVRDNREWFRVDPEKAVRTLSPLFDERRARWTTAQPESRFRVWVGRLIGVLGWISFLLLTLLAFAWVTQIEWVVPR